MYKGVLLMKNSEAYALWERAQKDPKLRTAHLRALDYHMQGLDIKAKELIQRYPSK
jgi:hypothetical protein